MARYKGWTTHATSDEEGGLDPSETGGGQDTQNPEDYPPGANPGM